MRENNIFPPHFQSITLLAQLDNFHDSFSLKSPDHFKSLSEPGKAQLLDLLGCLTRAQLSHLPSILQQPCLLAILGELHGFTGVVTIHVETQLEVDRRRLTAISTARESTPMPTARSTSEFQDDKRHGQGKYTYTVHFPLPCILPCWISPT